MKTPNFQEGAQKLTLLLRAAGLKGQQVAEAIRETTQSLMDEIRSEINNGNSKEVITFLATNAMIFGKNALFKKISSKVASRLMLRLGLPGVIAAGVVTILVPFVLMKLRKRALAKKDAGEFLETFEIEADKELQGKVQNLLAANTASAKSPAAPEEPEPKEKPREEPLP